MPTEPVDTLRAALAGFFLDQKLITALVSAAIIFLASLVLAAMARRAVRLAANRRKVMPQVGPLLTKLVYWGILILGLTVALQAVGINLTAVVAGLGIVGFTIGFALQDVSKNFISGILLLVSEPFKIGDLIEVSGYTGNVETIDLPRHRAENAGWARGVDPERRCLHPADHQFLACQHPPGGFQPERALWQQPGSLTPRRVGGTRPNARSGLRAGSAGGLPQFQRQRHRPDSLLLD